jgi:hypothetical protein
MRDHFHELWPAYAWAAAIVAVLAVVIPIAVRDQERWEAWCVGQGGSVDSHTDSQVVSTINAQGKPSVGVTSNTTYYCLTPDGRILDVR